MPYTPSSSAMTITATRRRRQKPTNWSIIEQDSALDHHLLAGLHAGVDRYLGALLEEGLDDAPLETPGRRGDEHGGAVVVHEECRGGQHHALEGRAVKRHGREHVRLERVVGIFEGDPGLVAAGNRVRSHGRDTHT